MPKLEPIRIPMNQEMVNTKLYFNIHSTIHALDSVGKYVENYCWLKETIEAMFLTINVQAPAEENFDQIVAMLKDTTASCPVIFNCQVKIQEETLLNGI